MIWIAVICNSLKSPVDLYGIENEAELLLYQASQ